MDFLKLTDGMMKDQKILINIKHIVTVERKDEDETAITVFGKSYSVYVTETPEEIWGMLNKQQRTSLNE